MPPEIEPLADILAESALARRITWGEADRVLRSLEHTQEQVEAPMLTEAQHNRLRLVVARAQDILARITEPAERSFWLLQAPYILEDLPLEIPSNQEWAQIQPPAPSWWQGATAAEIVAFDLYPGGPSGADLPLLSREELRSRMALCRVRLEAEPSDWLLRYVDKLLAAERDREEAVR